MDQMRPLLDGLGFKQTEYNQRTNRVEFSDPADQKRVHAIRFLQGWSEAGTNRAVEVVHLKGILARDMIDLLRFAGPSIAKNGSCDIQSRYKGLSLAQILRMREDAWSSETVFLAAPDNRTLLVQGPIGEVSKAKAFAEHVDAGCVPLRMDVFAAEFTVRGAMSNTLMWIGEVLDAPPILIHPTNPPIACASNGFSYAANFEHASVSNLLQQIRAHADARNLSLPQRLPLNFSHGRPLSYFIDFEYRDYGIGLELRRATAFLPEEKELDLHISVDHVGGEVMIDGNQVPIITRRDLEIHMPISRRSLMALGGFRLSKGNEVKELVLLLRCRPAAGQP